VFGIISAPFAVFVLEVQMAIGPVAVTWFEQNVEFVTLTSLSW